MEINDNKLKLIDKLNKNIACNLNDDEIKILYGIDNDYDRELEKYRLCRKNTYNDLYKLYKPEQIATDPNEITENTEVYIGDLLIGDEFYQYKTIKNKKDFYPYNLRYIYGSMHIFENKTKGLDNIELVTNYIELVSDEPLQLYPFLENLNNTYVIFRTATKGKLNGIRKVNDSELLLLDLSDKDFLKSILDTFNIGEVKDSFTEKLQKDTDLFMYATKINTVYFKYCPNELRGNKEFVIDTFNYAMHQGFQPLFLEYISDNLKHDKELALYLVKNYGEALFYFDDNIKNDKEVLIEAVTNEASVLDYSSDKIKNDVDFMIELFKLNSMVLNYLSDEVKNNPKFNEVYNANIVDLLNTKIK